MQELCKLQIKASKIISRDQSKRSKSLMEESQLYVSYLNKDFNIYDIVTDLIQRQENSYETIHNSDFITKKQK
ncbi:19260_t:CDS:2 [Funneliformis geosporum]|uniref:19260_t:CDS:1 n=1 Tax=Funneliformis geosporum TaxID=1117311 RepID=A0A9W4X2L5_9GLOM|nr:19260_t:CDS:2 [Funneliformis geosporum]